MRSKCAFVMQKSERYLPYLCGLLLLILWILQLQSVQEFLFYHREQQQVLAWDWDIIFQRYHGVAGPSLFLAHCLTQLFFIKWAGAVVTAVLAVIAMSSLWFGCKRIAASSYCLFPLCALPVMFELSNISDQYYLYHGFVSFVILCLFVAIYAWLSGKFTAYARVGVGIVISLLLLYIAGPVSLVLAVFIPIYDLLTRGGKWYLQILTLLMTLLATYLAERWSLLPSMQTAFSQGLYYNVLLSVPASLKYSWIGLLVLPFVFFGFSLLKTLKGGKRFAICAVLLVGAIYGTYALGKKDSKNADMLLELQHDVIVEDWDAILSSTYANTQNYLVMNYVNLALSKKQMLLSHFYRFPQHDPQNIMVDRESTDTNVQLSFIFSFITYQMGDMGAAQNHAHDTFVCTTYGQPTMLKMLVKTNLIKGAYPVADKYITLLEKTWRYSSWAKEMRRFLYNDEAVAADPELGLMRRDLPADDTTTANTFECLIKTLETNPQETRARDYLIAYLLLYRDQDDINRVVEKFHGTPALTPFPVQLQEAFLLVNDGNVAYCQPLGVSDDVIQRYRQFMTFMNRSGRSGQNPAQTMRKDFGNTVWYQFMFN